MYLQAKHKEFAVRVYAKFMTRKTNHSLCQPRNNHTKNNKISTKIRHKTICTLNIM